jgi:glycolate oxidase subunit GlcD
MDERTLDELRAALGRDAVLTGTRALPYESDGLALLAERPEVVLLPRDTAQTAAALRILHDAGVPVVGRGAGTGLSGGATPVRGGAVVGTARMRRILELDPVDRYARVEAGVVNADLSLAAKPHGLYYAPDPSSQQACTLGGNVGENSGGPHCFRHGGTTQHVLGLVVVLEDGALLDLAGPRIEPAGLDLVGMFVGSEGTLGIATELTLKLTPIPAAVETLLAVFAELDPTCDSASDIIAAGLEPSAIEILDALTIRAVEASVYAAGYPADAGGVLLVEAEGGEADVESTMRAVRAIVERRGAIEVRAARDGDERKRLWAGRKGAFGAMGRIAPDLYVADAVVPRTKLREMVAASVRVCQERGLRIATVFHAGDGNLHPNICYDRRDADETRRVLEAGDLILRACVDAGGALTGEHGVGLEKLAHMSYLFTRDDLEQMCRAREAWDPQRRLNPGKLVPTPVCMEARAAGRPLGRAPGART